MATKNAPGNGVRAGLGRTGFAGAGCAGTGGAGAGSSETGANSSAGPSASSPSTATCLTSAWGTATSGYGKDPLPDCGDQAPQAELHSPASRDAPEHSRASEGS